MAKVKPESKEILLIFQLHINLQLCEPKNLLEKKKMLLGHIFCDTSGSAWKASASGALFGPLAYTLQIYMHIKNLDHSDTNGNPKAKYDCAALAYLMAGSLILRQTNCLHWLFYRQEAKCIDVGPNDQVHKILSHAMGRPDL